MDGPPDDDIRLDLRGLKCPLPVLRARKALAAMAAGQVVRIECTDALAVIDIPHFAQEHGHTLLSATAEAECLVFRIAKAGART